MFTTMNKNLKRFLCVLLTLSIGTISGIATSGSIDNWYTTLQKPSFNPPNFIFAPVWTILYILMGISLFLILESENKGARRKAIIVFGVQLFLNFCWSFLFFKYHLLAFAFIEILLMWFSILTMIFLFYKIQKTAAYLQIPYLLWVSFASILNGAIWYLN